MSGSLYGGTAGGMVLDLFAGPGGWDVAARQLGIDTLGIEWDDAACETRRAAGLPTVQGDVAALSPGEFGPDVEGLIASPPCQAWSMAGKREGEKDKHLVYQALADLEAGDDTRHELRARCEDDRSLLVVEPLRWVLGLHPTWIALEQVPPVLELWQEYRRILTANGWRVWTGILSAERYGVPQTRRRAILMAHRDRYPAPPQATHQAYVPGEPARHEITLEGELLPWVSMAEALGWGEGDTPSPAPTVTGGGTEQGGVEVFASKASRERARRSVQDRPAPTIVTGRRSKDGIVVGRQLPPGEGENVGGWNDGETQEGSKRDERERKPVYYRNGNQENAAKRREDEPAPTLHFGHALNSGVEWTTEPDEPWRSGKSMDRLDLKGDDWPEKRPATTIAADPRVFQPGGHHANDGRISNPEDDGRSQNAVRVTEQEAAILQGFPPDYPFAGSRTKRFEQIGNAVPPPLARAVLGELIDQAELEKAA